MFCENCGKELKDNAKFCENCGAKVKILPESEVPSAEAQQEEYAQAAPAQEAPQEAAQEVQQPQQGWQDQSPAQEAQQPQQGGWQDSGTAQPGFAGAAQQPQQGGWQDPNTAQGGPAPQQQGGWQDPNAAQGGPAPQQQGGWQSQNASQGGPAPQPQQNWQDPNAGQNSFGGSASQMSGDLKQQFLTIVGLGKPVSGLSIAALVLSLLCCGFIGVILAVVDIVNDKDHTQNHLCSVIAIAIAVIGLFAGFTGGAATMISDSLNLF